MAMMGSAEAGCWPSDLARAFCSSIAWRTAGIPPRTSCSAMGAARAQCRQRGIAVRGRHRRATVAAPCLALIATASRTLALGAERPLRSPGTPRHRSGVQRCCDPARGALHPALCALAARLAELRGPSRRGAPARPLPRERSSPRPGRSSPSRRRLCPVRAFTGRRAWIDGADHLDTLRLASSSSAPSAGTLMTSMPSMPTSISARTTPPRRRRRTSDASTTPFGWRAPAASR